jgi:hypothetical protein
MSLVKEDLKGALKAIFNEAKTKEKNQDEVIDWVAEQFANAIDEYVRSAKVTTDVTGTCQTPSGSGTISGKGTGSLS